MRERMFDALAWIDWKINPVLLRDLRLFMRGRLMVVGYFFTVAALVLLSILYVFVSGADGSDGRTLLDWLTTILLLVCGALIPNFVQERFRGELANRATELALMSPLTPSRLVRGKIMGAWALSLMVLSAAAPMLVTAYLLGGIDPIMFGGCIASVVAAAAAMPAIMLFFAGDGGGRGLSWAWNGLVFLGAVFLMLLFSSLVAEAFGAGYYRTDFRYLWLGCVIAGGLFAQFLYFVTVSRLRTAAENRAAAPRISLAAAAVLGFGATAFLYHLLEGGTINLYELFSLASIFACWAFCAGFLALLHGADTAPEQRRFWPDRPIVRLLLSPGVPALAAFFIICTIPLLAFAPIGHFLGRNGRMFSSLVCLGAAPVMALGYGILAYWYVVKPASGHWVTARTFLFTVFLVNAITAVASIFFIVISTLSSDVSGGLLLGFQPVGLIYASDTHDAHEAAPYALAVLIIMYLLLAPIALKPLGKPTDGPPHAP